MVDKQNKMLNLNTNIMSCCFDDNSYSIVRNISVMIFSKDGVKDIV